MSAILASMQVLLPRAASDERFASAEEREAILAALQTLGDNALALGEHARPADASRRYLADALARDAAEALVAFEAGKVGSAQFRVQMATSNCVACHTQLPSAGDSPLAVDFVADSLLVELPPEERVRLLVATRRFDEALGVYEALLRSDGLHAGALLQSLREYLTLSIRVRNDLERPAPVLARFAARPDLWRLLAQNLADWSVALSELAPAAHAEPTLAAARRIGEEGRALQQFPADRASLIHDLVASSILHRLLAQGTLAGPQRAEAYYLLGVAQNRIGDSFWVHEVPVFFEASIRADPGGPVANDAWALLEENVVLGYTGSGGVRIPRVEIARLARLRALIDVASRPGSSPGPASDDD
jgi:tetratricopeptide (TPR) repeat protein